MTECHCCDNGWVLRAIRWPNGHLIRYVRERCKWCHGLGYERDDPRADTEETQ